MLKEVLKIRKIILPQIIHKSDHTILLVLVVITFLLIKYDSIVKIINKDLYNVFCRLFEERCISIMDSMYQEDSKHAIDLMDDEANIWGIHSSPLTFAYENFMYNVVAHTCSQKYINIKWYNNLAPDLAPFLQVYAIRIKIKSKKKKHKEQFMFTDIFFSILI